MKLKELLAQVDVLKSAVRIRKTDAICDAVKYYEDTLMPELARRLRLAEVAMKRIWNESEKYPIPLANFASEAVDQALREIGSSPK